jgi:hypothetical protein
VGSSACARRADPDVGPIRRGTGWERIPARALSRARRRRDRGRARSPIHRRPGASLLRCMGQSVARVWARVVGRGSWPRVSAQSLGPASRALFQGQDRKSIGQICGSQICGPDLWDKRPCTASMPWVYRLHACESHAFASAPSVSGRALTPIGFPPSLWGAGVLRLLACLPHCNPRAMLREEVPAAHDEGLSEARASAGDAAARHLSSRRPTGRRPRRKKEMRPTPGEELGARSASCAWCREGSRHRRRCLSARRGALPMKSDIAR